MAAKWLIFLGPPGSGKGTQAQRVCGKFELTQLSSGDVLRHERQIGSDIGNRVAAIMDSGQLVSDELITGVMLAAIDRLGRERGFILDGFPRTLPQAESLAGGLRERGMHLDAVVDLLLDDEEIIRRIEGRRVCVECGATYNVSFLPPKVEGVCDKCGRPSVIQRPDDRRDVVATRLATYRRQTVPLIEYYERQGCLHVVDASVPAAEVEERISRIIERAGSA
ncbi:MAG: adenylate kinase [Phycisphaerales bacterium]|nr:adenylate kinase [Phycisphaerales bacterium]